MSQGKVDQREVDWDLPSDVEYQRAVTALCGALQLRLNSYRDTTPLHELASAAIREIQRALRPGTKHLRSERLTPATGPEILASGPSLT